MISGEYTIPIISNNFSLIFLPTSSTCSTSDIDLFNFTISSLIELISDSFINDSTDSIILLMGFLGFFNSLSTSRKASTNTTDI